MVEETENHFVLDDSDKSRLKDRPFNAWRVSKSDFAHEVINDVLDQLQSYEKRLGLRERRRKARDQETFERTVAAVICDMIYHHLTHGPEQKVFISRSNRVLGMKSRYRPPALGKTLPDILDRLASSEMGFLRMNKGELHPFGKSVSTTVKAGPRLVDMIEENSLSLQDLGKEPGAEVIHLKREKSDFWDDGGLIEYKDTPTTELYRQQMLDINSWLDSLDVFFDDTVLGDTTKVVDTQDRSLRRIFTKGQFESGGRLFGGFWQELSRTRRLEGLNLNEDSAVELDYGQMGPRILYGMYDAIPPEGDAYTIPGFEKHRKGVKKVFNALFFTEAQLNRMPQGVRQYIPKRYSVHDVIKAIVEAHLDIAEAFGTGIGHQVQFRESQILVALLLRLKGEGISALPIHDAVIVPHSMKDHAKQIMLDVFKDHTGVDGVVTEEEA